MAEVRRRKQPSSHNKPIAAEESSTDDEINDQALDTSGRRWSLLCMVNCVLGLSGMIACGFLHAQFMATLHENNMWFSNIREVEREISFRTESGLYYSYYKQLVEADTLHDGLHSLCHDNLTEHPNTVNILSRMNVYQEVLLAAVYRALPGNTIEPIMFYVYAVFCLHGFLVCGLYVMTWMISDSWLAGCLAAAFYSFSRSDTTRVEFIVPLRESFSLPFLWIQLAAITCYFKPNIGRWQNMISVGAMAITTFFFTLFWQFNQFVLLLQAFALFGVWILDLVPGYKVRCVFLCQVGSILITCCLQFINLMLLESLVLSFIMSAVILMYIREKQHKDNTSFSFKETCIYSFSSLFLMLALNINIKFLLGVGADSHIYKFVMYKLQLGYNRDFDVLLYQCSGAFHLLPLDTYQRLSENLLFPVYAVSHVAMGIMILIKMKHKWRSKDSENNLGPISPELAFHIILSLMFGVMGASTLRMKLLWTPYMCVIAATGVSHQKFLEAVTGKVLPGYVVRYLRHSITFIVLGSVFALGQMQDLENCLAPAMKDLEVLNEFWDPDTVDLMEWIKGKTPPSAAFSGTMQLMAGVKLCTGRPITNHPHYEDKELRDTTKQIYQMYGKRPPLDVHSILKQYQAGYIILEDSVCLYQSPDWCSTPDIVDLDNGMLPERATEADGLVPSSTPRFCDEVRRASPEYTKYFKLVFENKTFRIYEVL